MKVYLASRYGDRGVLVEVRGALFRVGVGVTSRWLDGHHGIDAISNEERGRFAQEDLDDIDAADAFVLWNPRHHHRTGRGGRHVETGHALARRKRVILVGERENVFHYLPQVEVVKDFPSLMGLLDVWSPPATTPIHLV